MKSSTRRTAGPAIDLTTRVLAAIGVVALMAGFDPILGALDEIHGALAAVVFLVMTTFIIALALLAVGLEARPEKAATTSSSVAGKE